MDTDTVGQGDLGMAQAAQSAGSGVEDAALDAALNSAKKSYKFAQKFSKERAKGGYVHTGLKVGARLRYQGSGKPFFVNTNGAITAEHRKLTKAERKQMKRERRLDNAIARQNLEAMS
jgi:hypothetical protein